METTHEEKLQEIGASAYESIEDLIFAGRVAQDGADADVPVERLAALKYSEEDETVDFEGARLDAEDLRERVLEDPLEILVRTEWHAIGAADVRPDSYQILLSTGGPATRIVGGLDEHGEPTSATLEAQDWFQPWTAYRGGDREVLEEYAGHFCFAS